MQSINMSIKQTARKDYCVNQTVDQLVPFQVVLTITDKTEKEYIIA